MKFEELHCADIDRIMHRALVDRMCSAGAVAASVGSHNFHVATYGKTSNAPNAFTVEHDTLFDIASLSKPLGAGLAALYCVSKKRLDLDAPIASVLPDFKAPHFQHITISMLLDHTSGMPPVLDVRALWPQAANVPNDASNNIRYSVSLLEPTHAPESKIVYSDVGFMILGWVLEAITGKPLDVFLQSNIYKPLDLERDILFVHHRDLKAKAALQTRRFVATETCAWRQNTLQGEVHDPVAWAMGGVAGHAGLFATLRGVTTLMQRLLACYRAEDHFFHPGTVSRFFLRSRRPADTTRTLAWDTPSAIDSTAGKRFSRSSVGHLGFTGTSIWMDLLNGVLGVVLTNAVHPHVEGKREALKIFRPKMYEAIAAEGIVQQQHISLQK